MADIPPSTFRRDMDFGRNRVEPRRYGVWRYGVGRYSASDPTRFAWGRVKPAALALILSLFLAPPAAADTLTPGLNLIKISVDVEDPTRTWGSKEDENKDILDAAICDKRVGCTINGQLIVQTTIQAAAIIAESSVSVSVPLTGDGLTGTPIGVDSSSVTLLGPSIGASEVDSDIATQTDLDNIAVSTNALSVSTAALQTVQDALSISTAGLQVEIDTLSISTANLKTVQDAISISTEGLQTVQDALIASTIAIANGSGIDTAAITTTKIADDSVTKDKIAADTCVDGQILKLSGSVWTCATDEGVVGSSGWVDAGGVVQLATAADLVGIGIINPSTDLEISKSAGSPVSVMVANRLFGNEFADAIYISSVASTFDGDPHSRYTVGGGAGEWNAGIHNSDSQKYKISRSRFENEFVITTTGDVGISTGIPQSKLDVAGTITATGLTCPNCGTTTVIADGAVTTVKLIAGAATTSKISPDAVTEVGLLNGAVTTSKVGSFFTDHTDNASSHHTATVNTDAESKCSGSQSLRGDGSCTAPGGGSGDAVLAATQTWTGANTYTSSLTITNTAPEAPAINTIYSDSIVKGWCNFDGTLTGPITPRDEYNVVDVTDNGAGDYTINWDTDFANADYVIAGTAHRNGAAQGTIQFDNGNATPMLVGSVNIRVMAGSTPADADIVTVMALGDQ